MSVPLQFAVFVFVLFFVLFCLFVCFYCGREVFVRPDCLSNSTSNFLIGDVVFVWNTQEFAVAPHLYSLDSLLSRSAVRVHDSQAKRNVERTSKRINPIFDLSVMFLSLQTIRSFLKDAVVCAILDRISGFEPWSNVIAPRYLKVLTVSSFSPLAQMSVLMPLGLLRLR